ncbi:hypothetical protein JCM13304A_24030 [Desulfothermus okinawensis JCM 13304]
MDIRALNLIERLEKSDQEKIIYFLKLLINQEKYRKLKEEVELRKKEIERGEIFTHEEIWNKIDVQNNLS